MKNQYIYYCLLIWISVSVAPKIDVKPRIILHENIDFRGERMSIDNTVDNLNQHDFNGKVSSITVESGIWVLYSHSNFRGTRYVVSEGKYRNPEHWGGEYEEISSLRPMSEEPKITLNNDINFTGKESVIVNRPVAHLSDHDLDNQVSSITIHAGIWVLFQYPNYKGKQYVVSEGYFSSSRDWNGEDNEISSLCPLNRCPFEEEQPEPQDKMRHKEANCGNSASGCGWSFWTKAAIGLGTLAAAPFVLPALGFTTAGISAGSYAASMMSSAAIAGGGSVAAGSTVAVLQSVGTVGVGIKGAVMMATGVYVSVDMASRAICGRSEKTDHEGN